MSFKVKEEVVSKTYLFDGEFRVSKQVMKKVAEKDAIGELFSIIQDVYKRVGKDGLTNPVQAYSHEKLGLDLIIEDKMSKEELADESIDKLKRTRGHYCMIKLAK